MTFANAQNEEKTKKKVITFADAQNEVKTKKKVITSADAQILPKKKWTPKKKVTFFFSGYASFSWFVNTNFV